MIIDFKNIEDKAFEGFRGGYGRLIMRSFADDDCKIMRHILKPGAALGLHTHDDNCEIIVVQKGEATVHCDGKTELLTEGQVHYCPRGHSHYIENQTNDDIQYLAIIVEMAR